MLSAELGLLVSAFVSATLAPGGSEVLLGYLVQSTPGAWLSLVIIATIGNTLGSLTSYFLGRLGRRAKSPEALLEGKHPWLVPRVQRFGPWSLLLAWLPLIGDAIPLLAGWFRFGVLSSSLLIFIGKFFRYLVIALTMLGIINQL
ncbi:DedA family protein [Ferrimonas sediminicola]|uniref:DedA family protein n=1 Tax=Ferrimonas sediminicola TaxID=2569538 RepID=A0A4U1B895_9GAMM|nr:YqaA family protein [Ferrimonas sediminicola]TKB46878.1 DedA family protein [Ferrimonas sediminicola]